MEDGYRRMRKSLLDIDGGEGHFEGPPPDNVASLDDGFEDENEQSYEPDLVKWFTKSSGFQAAVGVVIGLNIIIMWLELDYPWGGWYYFENTILLFFVAELTLRLYTFRTDFFISKDKWWNLFDLAVVTFGVGDLWIIQPLSEDKGSSLSRFVTILRVVRMFRLLRLIRLFRFLQQLYVLATAVVEAVSVVGWITLMFLLIIMVFSIVCTTMVGKEWSEWSGEEDQKFIKMKFGTVLRSAFTLFQFVTLDDWSSCTALVAKEKPGMMLVFYVYITITAFTILSLLTGVISDKIMKLTQQQDDAIQKDHEESFKVFCDEVGKLFRDRGIRDGVQKSDRHKLTRMDFKKFVYESRPIEGPEGTEALESVGSRLKNSGIEVDDDDVDEMFDVLDVHHRGYVNQDEFVDGLQRMRGPAQAKDIVRLQGCVKKLLQQMQKTSLPTGGDFLRSSPVMKFSASADGLGQAMHELEGRFHVLEDKYGKFMNFHCPAEAREEFRPTPRSTLSRTR